MKRTDMLRRERELKKAQKKEERIVREDDDSELTVGDFIKRLSSLFFHDEEKIYNTLQSTEILEVLESMQKHIEERHWDSIIRKAVKATGVKQKEEAVKDLKSLLS